MKPLLAATATEASDEQLVAAARDGSDEAFETLFRRYRDRVVGYVRGMVSDHGRAEDIVQEAFMSALRSLRRTDQEITFRPWIYEIAKNACIDHLRRARRAQEVSIDSDDFSPADEGRLAQSTAETDAAVARRNEFESLRMAFHDLPSSQHQILVMRELEGLSYDKIGSRMGLTRGAVESLLFRARRRLRDGFDEIDTGARCASMRHAMEGIADGSARARDRRRLAGHLHDCKACRRTAVAMGLDSLVLVTQTDRARSALHRAAALLPLPAFLRRRLGDAGGALGPAAAQTGIEQGATLAGKATAVVVAAAIAAGGAGVTHKATGGDLPLVGGSHAPAASAGSGGGGDSGGGPATGDSAGNGVPGAPGQGFANSGTGPAGAVPGTAGALGPGTGPGSPGALPLTGPGLPPGMGGAIGEAGRGADALGGTGALPGKTVERLGSGDAGGALGGVVDTVDGVSGTVEKNLGGKVKTPKVKTPKVKTPKVKDVVKKVPKANAKPKVKQPDTGNTPGPSVTVPETQLPDVGTSGLSSVVGVVPDTSVDLSGTGLGL